MKYVILPIIEHRLKNNPSRLKIYTELFENWESEITGKNYKDEEVKDIDYKIKAGNLIRDGIF